MTEPDCGRSQRASQRRQNLRADPGVPQQPSVEELQLRVQELDGRFSEQQRTEDQLRLLNHALEQQVVDRTALADWRARQLRALISELTQAEERERRRIAELLHDYFQQQLVAVKFKLAGLQRTLRDAGPLEALADIGKILDESIDASRALTYELSPPVLYSSSFRAALEWLAEWKEQKHGLKVEIHGGPDVEPSDESVKVLLFQTIRELLFNVVKHAKTDRARIEFERRDDKQIQVAVCDEGIGFDPAALKSTAQTEQGFGLCRIRERLQWIGGQFQLESAPGRGTRAVVVIPTSPHPPAPQI